MARIEITNPEDIKSCNTAIEEQETVITFSRNDDIATIWTSDNTMITKLRRLVKDNPGGYRCFVDLVGKDETVYGYRFECPVKCVSLRNVSNGRTFTEEQRQDLARRLVK